MTTFQTLLSKISKKMVITFSIVLAIFLLIYWFQVRPSQIKANCQKKADEYSQGEYGERKRMLTEKLVEIQNLSESVYKNCLHQNGL